MSMCCYTCEMHIEMIKMIQIVYSLCIKLWCANVKKTVNFHEKSLSSSFCGPWKTFIIVINPYNVEPVEHIWDNTVRVLFLSCFRQSQTHQKKRGKWFSSCKKWVEDCCSCKLLNFLGQIFLYLFMLFYIKKHTPRINILVVLKYKANKIYLKKIVYFDYIISSFSTKISWKWWNIIKICYLFLIILFILYFEITKILIPKVCFIL